MSMDATSRNGTPSGEKASIYAGLRTPIDFLKYEIGGAERDRTADLLVANEALSQLSYSPTYWNCAEAAQHPAVPSHSATDTSLAARTAVLQAAPTGCTPAAPPSIKPQRRGMSWLVQANLSAAGKSHLRDGTPALLLHY